MRTLHLVSHTHWDREWYLPFQQFRLKLVHLIDGLLDLLESDPRYTSFMLDGQTIVLEDYLAVRPEREQKLKQFIQEGRIVVGPWYVLPDEFLVSPEATLRNLLQGERTSRRFGPKMQIGYIPDPFGHIGQMPQILSGFGISLAALQRGLSDEVCELWWEAPDGSRVFLAYLRDGYGNAASLSPQDPDRFTSDVRSLRDSLLPHASSPHLLLLQGTDHMEPPRETPDAIAFTTGKLDGDELIQSTLLDYLTAARASLDPKGIPVVKGELRDPKRHHHLPGVLSTRMWIKQRNHACETLLEKWAEPFSTFAERIPNAERSRPVPHRSEILRAAWRVLMENHAHDSICGCSIDQVHKEMAVRFDQVGQIGEELTRQSLEALADAIHTQAGDPAESRVALVVFNPSGTVRTDVLSVTLELPSSLSAFDLVDEAGNCLPCQNRGLGGSELAYLTLSQKELRATFAQIYEGRAGGMSVQDLNIRREGSQVFLTGVMAEGGEPNLTIWHKARAEVMALMADPSVVTYHVRARMASATELVFTAPQVPALGFRTFWLRGRSSPSKPIQPNALARALLPLGARLARLPLADRLVGLLRRDASDHPPYEIENETFSVEVQKDGTVVLKDLRTGATYPGLNCFRDGGDCGDEYNYAPPPSDHLVQAQLKRVNVHRGAVEQTLVISLELKIPSELTPDRRARSQQSVTIPVTTRLTLSNGVPRLDIQTEVENTAKDHRLRVHFPAPFAAEAGQHDGHFEILERPIGVPAFDETWIEQPRPEVPQRAFSAVSNGRLGLLIANRGLPEVEILQKNEGNSEIALTLLRCVGWLSRDDFSTRKGHAGPNLETPGAQMHGRWTFEYAVLPYHEAAEEAISLAYEYQTPMRAIGVELHNGSLTAKASFVTVAPRAFVVSAVKEAEDGRGWLVRGYNITNETIQVTIRPWRSFQRVEQINLAEEKISDLKPTLDGSVSLPLNGHALLSVLFRDP